MSSTPLPAAPAATTSAYLERPDGCRIYYELCGPADGPVLVFSQTLFWDVKLFAHQVAAFSARGYRCVCYDHRGQNGSSPSDVMIPVEQSFDDAVALIEELGLAPVVFVGNSYGGFLAFRLACRRPDLVRGVVALGSSADAQASVVPQVSQADFQQLVDNIEAVGPADPALFEQIMFIMFGDAFLSEPGWQAGREYWGNHLRNMGRGVAKLAAGAVVRDGMLGELAACRTPIWLIHGEQDHAFPPASSSQAFDVLPDDLEHKKLVFVPDCGHSVAFETPDALNAHLAAFLAEIAY